MRISLNFKELYTRITRVIMVIITAADLYPFIHFDFT